MDEAEVTGRILTDRLETQPAWKRLHKLASIIHAVAPHALPHAVDALFNKETIKIDGEGKLANCRFMGAGHEQLVFEIQTTDNRFALKINQGSLFSDQGNATTKFEGVMEQYGKIAQLYKDIPGLIPEERVVQLNWHIPALGDRKAIGVIQPLIMGSKRCLFKDFTDETRRTLLNTHPELKDKVKKFAEITLNNFEASGWAINLYGYKLVTVMGDGEDLRILDPHRIVYKTELENMKPDLRNLFLARMEKLKELRQSL